MLIKRMLIFLSILLVFIDCSQKPDPLFRLISPVQSGITFNNIIDETDSINILTVDYMYHGGGVAVGDFNNDGLTDIFFTGNIVSNKLYLNLGGLKFQDVTSIAGVAADNKWKSGVAVADINQDGWLDIYVCATISKDSVKRANMLFINKGIDENGIPHFEENADNYGIADMGYSQNAAFFDYDKDGDLDLYVLTNLESNKIPSVYRPRILDGTALNNDQLYKNNGDGTFSNVTKEAGILIEGYGLGIAIADINEDGWPDIYIGNDYISNDILYINNGNGTFSNEIEKRLKHQSLFTMGVDIADINNDLKPDIITLDMLPENNLRRKTVTGAGAAYQNYINNIEFDYEFQYMRNMLHINNGNGTFSELGQMAGIQQTEWSWSSLFADVDNDGLNDLLVTNGFPKDVTDRDYALFKREVGHFNHIRSLLDSIPVLKVPNYGFKNNGDYLFSDKTREWGLNRPSFSNGAAFADLDNDGDLDYVVNNINDSAFLYENTLYTSNDEKNKENHFLRIKLEGQKQNSSLGYGSKITIRYGNGKAQYHDHSVYRGYLSTVEDIVHFGLGNQNLIDTVIVEWLDGKTSYMFHVEADQVINIKHEDGKFFEHKEKILAKRNEYFQEVSTLLGVSYKHQEWDKVDFYKQRTLPHKFSQAGPGLAVADINGDQLEDFIIGGSSLYDGHIFKQNIDGTFSSSPLVKTIDNKSEDEGLLFFDADNDGDQDLYIVSGSYEGEAFLPHYQDRLYLNDGNGNFSFAEGALPLLTSSGSCVRAADIDGDGDLDLFVGGRVVTGSYPLAAESYILRNDSGKFINVTKAFASELQYIGMVTDGLWTDYNNDGKIDLVVVGEFMIPTFFKNTGSRLKKEIQTGLEEYSGWYNSIIAADFDKDGDTDYIVGNMGLNNSYNISQNHPLRVYAKDLDDNESIDAILSYYIKSEQGELEEYPAHFWDELYSHSPIFRKQFSSFKEYGRANMQNLLAPYDTTGLLILEANYPLTSYIENQGNGQFRMNPLPKLAQVAPINGLLVRDVNQDGNLDVIMTGNDYGNEVFFGRYDASTGVTLLGDGKGNFEYINSIESGFYIDGDGKALVKLRGIHGELILATQNADSLKIFQVRNEENVVSEFMPLPNDSWSELLFSDGKIEKVEFYYGSGYLSQSTRSIKIPSQVKKIVVYDFSGQKRMVEFNGLASVSK